MLYLISTPIGNLNDISLRAIEVLKDADYIFAEDTRNTSKLLKFINCEKRCKSLHEHNEQEASNKIINILKESGNNIAVVSDAGTPAISDPGYYLIQKCIDNNLEFTVLPGPSSIINALVLSGLPTSSFSFLGFVPRKKSQKIQFFQSLKKEKNTILLFESAKRIENTLICIEDTGVGISRENVDKLFQNGTFTTRGTNNEKGTGLGLSICKELVELNGGSISVESVYNKGTQFNMEFPLVEQSLISQNVKNKEPKSHKYAEHITEPTLQK